MSIRGEVAHKLRALVATGVRGSQIAVEYLLHPKSRHFLAARVAAHGVRGAHARIAVPMSLYVTSACGLRCEQCIMMGLMDSQRAYQMSLHELEYFIRVSEASDYRFDLVLTGGEPTLWKSFAQGVKLLKCSAICNSLTLFTNAMSIDPLTEETVACLDGIRISDYNNSHANVAELQRRFGAKVQVVNREEFWQNPTSAVPNSLPAQCLNPEILLANYQVYACPHSAAIAASNGSMARLSNPLAKDFLKGLLRIKLQQQREVCSHCISNKRVRTQQQKVANLSQKEARSLRVLSDKEVEHLECSEQHPTR